MKKETGGLPGLFAKIGRPLGLFPVCVLEGKTAVAFHKYVEAQRKNLDSALKFELFATTCPLMDKLYEVSVAAVPNNKSPVFGQFLLICHKSFLAAATLIGQAQPDDAGPITRRAIEVVRVAAAIKDDPSFAKEWVAFEKRMQRWKDRDAGKTPKSFHFPIPVKHPLVTELMVTWGIISDSDVHFTPESFASLRWEKRDDKLLLQYFTGEQRTIETAIVTLLGAHVMMIRILDDCLEGAFSQNDEWQAIFEELGEKGKPWADKIRQRAEAERTPEEAGD